MWFASASLQTRSVRRIRWARPGLEWLGTRNVLSPAVLPAEAFPGPSARVAGTLGPGETAVCPVTVKLVAALATPLPGWPPPTVRR